MSMWLLTSCDMSPDVVNGGSNSEYESLIWNCSFQTLDN